MIHIYVTFERLENGTNALWFAVKPDDEFNALEGRTTIFVPGRIYHVAFDLITCDREYIWEWFKELSNGTAKTSGA
jgi:hypothetical protein